MRELLRVESRLSEIIEEVRRGDLFWKGCVSARKVSRGEQVELISNSRQRHAVVVDDECWIVRAHSGIVFAMHERLFLAEYQRIEGMGLYQSTSYCRAIPNPFQKPIGFVSPNGEIYSGARDCFIVDFCDKRGRELSGNLHLVESVDFCAMYVRIPSAEKSRDKRAETSMHHWKHEPKKSFAPQVLPKRSIPPF